MKKQVNKVVEAVKSVPNIWKNLVHLIEAISLVVVSGVAFWTTYEHAFSTSAQAYLVRFCAVVIALLGASQILKYLNRK